MSIYKTRAANSMAAAPATAPMTDEYKMNAMAQAQQPVVQDPRYGGPQMA